MLSPNTNTNTQSSNLGHVFSSYLMIGSNCCMFLYVPTKNVPTHLPSLLLIFWQIEIVDALTCWRCCQLTCWQLTCWLCKHVAADVLTLLLCWQLTCQLCWHIGVADIWWVDIVDMLVLLACWQLMGWRCLHVEVWHNYWKLTYWQLKQNW